MVCRLKAHRLANIISLQEAFSRDEYHHEGRFVVVVVLLLSVARFVEALSFAAKVVRL